MGSFAWNDNLRVGNTFIDNDHRHMIALMRELHAALEEKKGREVLESMLSDLIQYTQEHFKREEDVMQGMRYAEFVQHKQEHERLIYQVLLLRKRFADGEVAISGELSTFLYEWLFDHILKVDKKLAKTIRDARVNPKH